MTHPGIRYVRSADGTRIAVCTLGHGQPLVMVHNFYVTIETLWEIPEAVENLERLSRGRMVVLYDSRGSGLSNQPSDDFSLDAGVADLAAVVDDLDSPTVDVTCNGPTTTIAIAYAARHPAKVRRLALQSPVLTPGTVLADERRRIILELGPVDWEFYLECLALLNFGWTDVGRRVAEKHIKEANWAVWRGSMDGWRQHDVSSLIAQVKCPTLVLLRRKHRGRGNFEVSSEEAGELAAALPNARLMRYDEDHSFLLASNWDSCLRLVEEFLAEGDEALPPSADLLAASTTQPQGTAVIMFTDIVSSTALTERMGDTAFRDASRALDAGLRTAIRDAGGASIDGKLLGDGVLATFSSAAQAIDAARRCLALSAASELGLHIGLHAGDVIREDNNVYGGAVNIASRICGLSAPGEILVSDIVRGLARTSAGVEFEDRGEQDMKGVGEPVRVYAVRGGGE